MKSTLLFILGFTGLAQSQITLTSADMPAANDTLRISNAVIDPQLDFLSTGANYHWNFSGLQSAGQQLNDYRPVSSAQFLIQLSYGPFAEERYRAGYYISSTELPIAELTSVLPVSIENIYQFSRTTADSLTLIGYSMTVEGQELPVKSDTIETKYQFPLHFGDSYSSRGYTALNLNPIYNAQWRQHRLRTSTVDGWGEILTPYGTFDVLRIHHVIAETDSFYINVNNFSFWAPIPIPETHVYEWRAAGQQEPILQVNTSMLGNQEQITGVTYRNQYIATAGLSANLLQVQLYPNPAGELLTVSAAQVLDGYAIYSSDGKLVDSQTLSPASHQNIAVGRLPAGVYYLELKSASGSSFQSFVK
jgi:hypothetical protein